ncbi:MAG TPA: hypothetical protein DEV93_18750 [Chloroflexi bacterium]|nr:hypothetical protein [Chloroflexota bacterium]
MGPLGRRTQAVNTPVQGTAADGFKAALAELWRTRSRFPSAVPVLALHDELVMQCDAQDAGRRSGMDGRMPTGRNGTLCPTSPHSCGCNCGSRLGGTESLTKSPVSAVMTAMLVRTRYQTPVRD